MAHVDKPNQAQAQKLCDDLAELLGIPDPIAYPGTDRWAVPEQLLSGTWVVPVPRKGAMREWLDDVDADPAAAKDKRTVDHPGKPKDKRTVDHPGKPKKTTPAKYDACKADVDAARTLLPSERKS